MEDRILEEIRKDPKVEKGLHEHLKLEELKDHPGWQYQAARFAGFRRGVMMALARRLMSGQEIDPKQIAFERGYAAAIVDVFEYPERIEKDLQRAAEVAFERLQEELSEPDDD